MATKKSAGGSTNVDVHARKLHDQWLRQNHEFVRECQNKPGIYNCSRDFDRAVPWRLLPQAWKAYYRREAKYALIVKKNI